MAFSEGPQNVLMGLETWLGVWGVKVLLQLGRDPVTADAGDPTPSNGLYRHPHIYGGYSCK